jgi:hypothetical protein
VKGLSPTGRGIHPGAPSVFDSPPAEAGAMASPVRLTRTSFNRAFS